MLYFAYGSNLNTAQMARRCPAAKPLCKFMLQDTRLVFRGVADCADEPGAECPGGIWKITPACERSLDRYEGVDGGLYRKVYLPVEGAGDENKLMLYVMNSTGIMPPTGGYLDGIVEGYRDFGLPLEALQDAVQRAWDDKDLTFPERARRHRDGYPRRAKPAAIILPEKTGKATTGAKVANHRKGKSK